MHRKQSAQRTHIVQSAKGLEGSAVRYLPEGHPAAPYLYAIRIARSCKGYSGGLCYEMPTSGTAQELITTTTQPVTFIERMYIHRGTKSGPAVSETILPKLVHFR